jgi:hypothetical protein
MHPPQEGGLGLFELKSFIISLQSTWVKRALALRHDNWRNTICRVAAGTGIVSRSDSETFGTVLKGIINNYILFRNRYGTAYNNFLTVPILDNNFFDNGKNDARILFNEQFLNAAFGNIELDRLKSQTCRYRNPPFQKN